MRNSGRDRRLRRRRALPSWIQTEERERETQRAKTQSGTHSDGPLACACPIRHPDKGPTMPQRPTRRPRVSVILPTRRLKVLPLSPAVVGPSNLGASLPCLPSKPTVPRIRIPRLLAAELMVITAKRVPALPDSMPAEVPVGREPRSHAPHVSSFKIPKTWGSRRLLRFLNVNGNGKLVGDGWRSAMVGYQGSGARRPRVRAQEAKTESEADAEVDEKWFEEEARGKLEVVGERRRMGATEEDEVEREEEEEDDGAFLEVREKLMVHLREAADRVQLPVGPKKEGETEREAEPAPSSAAAEATRPWNLRARTTVRRVIRYGFEPEASVERGRLANPVRPRSLDAAGCSERPRFSISLSTEEIEEDVYAVTGSLPRRRPRKRARVVQRQLDALFPGSWLTEITADSYKVADQPSQVP